MMKVMNHQLDAIKASTQEVRTRVVNNEQELVELEHQMDLDENKIFKEFHETRLKRKRLEIEQGLIYVDEEELVQLCLAGLSIEQIEEMKAKSEL